MKKTIAIIGAAGHMGSAMAYVIAKAGYRTLITDHDKLVVLAPIGKLSFLEGKIRALHQERSLAPPNGLVDLRAPAGEQDALTSISN
jgi:3-hydroxyacyl-CoA dehydrogenase